MVGTGGEELRVGGVGVEPAHPLGDQLGVRELLRPCDTVDDEHVRILGVAGVDGGEGRLEATAAGAHGFGRRSILSTRMPSSMAPSASPMMPKSW